MGALCLEGGPSAGEGEGTEHCGWLSCRSHRTRPPINQYAPPDPCFAPPVGAIRAAGKPGFFMGRSPLSPALLHTPPIGARSET
jgi:hypothetical protein